MPQTFMSPPFRSLTCFARVHPAFLALGIWGCCVSGLTSDCAAQEKFPAAEQPAAKDPAEAPRGQSTETIAAVHRIFEARCVACHGAEKREGGLRLIGRRDLFRRNDSGDPAVVAGKPQQSELFRRVSAKDESVRMPPEGAPLSTAEQQLIRDWIAAGAAWEQESQQSMHWAYQTVQRPAVPDVELPAVRHNAIDNFVQRRLQQEQLQPSAQADPARLIRRVSLDLIGLPPSPEQVAEFVKDPSPAHYEAIVDRLLKSPRYGEHWAQQWLDLARYADSNGYQADQLRQMWAYRDWVIDAMNQDMPFDQFTIEQLAGDLLPDATMAQQIATGFHRCTTCNVEAGVDPEENRVNQIFDRVNTTATVWMGTTMECAQCHNHKYDPFTQQDYYQLFAFFNNTPLEVRQQGSSVTFDFYGPEMDLKLDEAARARKRSLENKLAKLKQRQSDRGDQLLVELQPEFRRLQSASGTATWRTIDVVSAVSTGGATMTVQKDGSVLVTGKQPDKDTYRIRARLPIRQLQSVRLTALTDDAIPGGGPGRGSAERPNFVLNEFSVWRLAREVSAPSGSSEGNPSPDASQPPQLEKIELKTAAAGFSQKNYDVGGAIDDDPKTAWAINPRFNESHAATFGTGQPVELGDDVEVEFRLVQNYGGCRAIGRVLIEVSESRPDLESLPASLVKILERQPAQWSDAERQQVLQQFASSDEQWNGLATEIEQLQKQIDAIQPPRTLVMVEMDESRPTRIMKRGNFLTTGAAVEPQTPETLPELGPDRPANRLGLAQWLVSRENPLTARVAVNRWWARIFGQGLVASLEDFGTQGDRPTHPELLDWLAAEFMDSGWSMKHVHRLIVMSAAYRQTAVCSPDLRDQDPYNELYARGPRLRMSAEMIRDNALTISGLLSTKMHGPPIYPPQPDNIWRHIGRNAPKFQVATDENRFRRGVYVVWRRSAPYAAFVNFDAPDRASCVVQRSRTNTPLQALNLMNDEAYVEMAQAMAQRVLRERPEGSAAERAEYAFQLAVARSPRPVEVQFLTQVVEDERQRLADDPQRASQLAGLGKGEPGPAVELAAWSVACSLLLNLDETITK